MRPAARAAVGEVGFNEPLPPNALDEGHDQDGPQFVWVRYAADEAPCNGLEYVADVEGRRTEAPRTPPSRLNGRDWGLGNQALVRPVLLRVPEAARLASMTERALRHLIQRSLLPRGVVVWHGRAVFIDCARFEATLRQSMPGRSTVKAHPRSPKAGGKRSA